ncbi:MAG: hypothetical protein KDD53_10220, partial [Bdellovibrionales bacterium]|nr:hypothetical protein [Bdellovibrionales bacterium]
MTRKRKKAAKQPGMSPGSIIHVGERKVGDVVLSMIDFGAAECNETPNAKLSDLVVPSKEVGCRWINVCGLHDTDLIRSLGERFNVHPLALEDVVNTTHRPKIEDFG